MRTLKFRAWHEKMGWANEVTVFGDGSWSARFGQIEGYDEADGVVLMQFSGLHDKHGTDIYEGDIVHMNEGYLSVNRYRVYWNEDRWGLEGRNSIGKWEDYDNGDYYHGDEIDWNDSTVIGNIHETPDLLESH